MFEEIKKHAERWREEIPGINDKFGLPEREIVKRRLYFYGLSHSLYGTVTGVFYTTIDGSEGVIPRLQVDGMNVGFRKVVYIEPVRKTMGLWRLVSNPALDIAIHESEAIGMITFGGKVRE